MSPIKGLSENRRLIRLGKIHLGIKVKNRSGVEYPKATDYFVCPPEVQAVYGEQPDRLDIIIPVEDDEMWCNQYYRQYSRTRGLVCKGDGETCRRMIDRQTGAIANRDSKEVVWKEGPCQGRDCPNYQEKKCQEVMNLQFLLPRVPGLGIWQIDTGSINSIRNINDNAAMLRAVCDRVSWIPLTLALEPKEVVNPDDGKKKMVRCLNIRHDKGLLEILAAKDKPRVTLLIPTPTEDQQPLDEIPDDGAIEDEIMPPTQPKKAAETGEVISQDEDLFGEEEKTAAEQIGPTKVKPKQADWRAFWDRAGQLGLSQDQVHEMLRVTSVAEWTDQGKTLDEAIEVVSKKLSQQEASEAERVTGEGFNIDINWLKEALNKLKWNEGTVWSFVVSTYKVDGSGTFAQTLQRLTREQAEDFVNQINKRLEKQTSLF